MDTVSISRGLARQVGRMSFGPPVTHVYNPPVYARETNEEYIRRFAHAGIDALLLGMNPGPFGMAQTGVPFGEVEAVRSWLRIEGRVKAPRSVHPRRPVLGFECTRSEVSGQRLWGWARSRFRTPARFFERFFVWNYCPLLFLEASGRNRTPDKLPASERKPLIEACDRALVRLVAHLAPRVVVGIGKFAEGRARSALDGVDVEIGSILHPSPASPIANRGWAPQAERQLTELGIRL